MRFGHNVLHGGPDRHLSRQVGSIKWEAGQWVVTNDSEKHPFDIIWRGVANPLPPGSSPDSCTKWAISPPGLEIMVVAPSGRYVLAVDLPVSSIDKRRPRSADQPPEDETETFPVPLHKVTDHERLLLAAKFLSTPTSGDAVGNREAAEYANAARIRGKPITPKAVENCVNRWCQVLQELGVADIGGRENINNLGRQLLAWGFLRDADRKLLRPRYEHPAAEGPAGIMSRRTN